MICVPFIHTAITASPLPGRSGAIQAVINVDVPSPSLQYANIIAGKDMHVP